MASLDLIDRDIQRQWEERGLNAISGKSLFISSVSLHQDQEEALDGFIQCYHYLLSTNATTKGINTLLTCIVETLERCGGLFAEEPCSYENEWTTQDHILLLLTKIFDISTEARIQVTVIRQLMSLLEGSQFESIASPSLSIVALSILRFSNVTKEVVNPLALCLSKVISHPKWNDWALIETQLEGFSTRMEEDLVLSFVSLLFEQSSLLRSPILSTLLLPLLEQGLSKPNQFCCSQNPFLASFFLHLLPEMIPSLPGNSFILWSDCLSTCVKEFTQDTDWERLILFLTVRLRETKAYRVQMRCLALLYEMIVRLNEEGIEVKGEDTICRECVRLLKETNEKVLCRVIRLLPLVMKNHVANVSILVLLLFVNMVKKDVEKHSLSPSSVRQEAFEFLSHSSFLSLQALFRFGLLPLYPIREFIPQQNDVVELIRMVVKNDVVGVKALDSSNPIHRVLVEQLISICFGERSDTFYSTEQRRSSLATSVQGGSSVEEIQTLLEQANPTTLTTDLPPSLQSLTLVPFSTLQEALIRLSASFQNEMNLVCLLRLLRVINHVCIQRNRRLAQQAEDDRASIERQLNLHYLNNGILSCYLPFILHLITLPGSFVIQQELCLLAGQILSISNNYALKEYLLRTIDSPLAPLAVSVLLSVAVEDSLFLDSLLSYVKRHPPSIPLLYLVGHAVISNQLQDSFLQPILLTLLQTQMEDIRLIGIEILRSVVRTGNKGDICDFLLDVIIDWLESGLADDEQAIEPVDLLLQEAREAGSVNEKTLAEGIAQYFVKHPKASSWRLMKEERPHWTRGCVEMLEQFQRGEDPLASSVREFIRDTR